MLMPIALADTQNMTRIDQFESVFRYASKERFEIGDVPKGRVLVITDLDESDGTSYLHKISGLSVVFLH